MRAYPAASNNENLFFIGDFNHVTLSTWESYIIKTGIALITFLLLIQSAIANDGRACAACGGLDFICGPQNAEDLVLVPSSQWVLSSSMGSGGGNQQGQIG
ncbi:MAG: hypothetical protein ACI88A_002802 [Paraglaciecola sp.]|jgi:hypothetical protein